MQQGWNNGSFDFVQNIKLNESIKITRNVSGGFFASGVIQYAFTYYNMYGQESNIFYTSPINYISFNPKCQHSYNIFSLHSKWNINKSPSE